VEKIMDLKILNISVYNIFGAKINIDITHSSNSKIELKFNGEKPGVYYLQIETERGHYIKKMVVK